MSLYLSLGVVPAALLLGYLAGLLTFKRSNRWCPACGANLRCPTCESPATVRRPLRADR
jgi:hypothetical protein